MTIFKRLNIRSRGILLAKMPYDLDGAVNGIVMFDKSADKANDHGRRLGGCFVVMTGWWVCLAVDYGGRRKNTEDARQGRRYSA